MNMLNDEDRSKLNNLADRGIVLNEWQANELIFGGRQHGRTFLSYVLAAEDSLEDGGLFTINSDLTKYDKDADCHMRKELWLREFKQFISDYYNDVLMIGRGDCHIDVKLTPYPKKGNSRWWNIKV